ncbi:MAG: NUDIX domain-containing protein [Anaerolineales bacterium]|nr:NUDIX domain-containing protein [Anaerolineales bacterium]MCB0006072.1 NUDIX domain-containing protein [Anaerolineales bacterium]MCB8960376.1 NUDIX domain-containing protein [Ardenticatenales bacterium]
MGKADQKLNSGKKRYQVVPRSLIFLRNGDDVLLLKGAPTKRLWANMYNGVGGHIEVDEDIYSAAQRELHEETGLAVDQLKLRAITNLDAGSEDQGIMIFVFVGWTADRQTLASVEGSLHWLPVAELADQPLVEDLHWLLPKLFADDRFYYLHYSYDEQDKLVIREQASD